MRRRYLYFRLFVSLLMSFVPLPGLERRFYDLMLEYHLPAGESAPIAILDFDRGAALDGHSRLLNQNIKLRDSVLRPSDYPAWDDLVFSSLIRRLTEAKPALLVVTYPFPSTIDESRTILTAEAVRSTKIVWASRLLQEGDMEYPPSPLTPYNNYGFSNFFPDDDGVLRSADLFREGQVHLSLRALRELGGPLQGVKLEEPQLIDFGASMKEWPHLTLSQVLFQPASTWESSVRDRVVFIGVISGTLPSLFTPAGEFSRSELLALVYSNLSQPRGFFHKPPEYVQVLIAAFMMLITVFITFRSSVTWAAAWVAVQAMSLAGLAYLLFNVAHIWIYLASPFFTMLMTYSLMAHYLLITKEELRFLAAKDVDNLRKLDELKTNYISIFSHDLKTPIAKIDGVCDRVLKTAEGKDLHEKHRKEFETILECNGELKTYINNILQLARIESENVRLTRVPVDLNRIIEEMVQRIGPLARDHGVSVKMSLEPLFTMELDEKLVREIIQNVFENAIAYSRAGTEVLVSSREEGDHVIVSVSDNGPGIPREELVHVTEKFYRGKAAQVARGTGLGLYLVKYFTELHGGKLEVTSEVGKGTKVEMRFPVAV
jgi:signal transduction histidine kinase